MIKKPPVTIHRKDYTAPAYWVNTVEMGFDLDPAAARVATRITLQRNRASPNKDVELLGDGAKLVALGESIGSASIDPQAATTPRAHLWARYTSLLISANDMLK